MRHIMVASCLGVLALSSIGLNAGAQENAGRYLNERVAAPVDALELKFASGYTQGFGNLAPKMRTGSHSQMGYREIFLDFEFTSTSRAVQAYSAIFNLFSLKCCIYWHSSPLGVEIFDNLMPPISRSGQEKFLEM